MVSKHQDNTDLARRNTDLVHPGVASKPLKKGVASKLLGIGVANKPLEKGIASKPLEKGVANKPLEKGVANKPLEKGVANKPLEKGVANKPLEKDVASKPLEIGVVGKPDDLSIVGPLEFGTTDLVLQSNPEITHPDITEPEYALEQKHTEVIILVVCAFCLFFVVSSFRQRHIRARRAQEQPVIDSILAASCTLYPTMRKYDVVLRRVNSDDDENGWVSVLVGRNWREQECFLRQSRRHKKSTRADALGDLYLEMVAEMKA